nr:acetate--CoA ligase family protein [Aquihabitans sp.]
QDDPATDVVMLYLESFGNPSKFSRTARALSYRKPVVAVKVGGAAADHWVEPEDWPPDATSGALLEQTGIIRVDNLTQMFHTAGVLAHQPLPEGDRVAVVTNSWGPAWLAVDALKASGLTPAEPVDLSNEAEPERFTEALAEVYADLGVDAVLVIYAPAVTTHYKKVGAAIREAARRPGAVTTVACLLGQHGPSTLADDAGRVPQFPFPEEAALALGRVASYATWRARPVGTFCELPADDLAQACQLVGRWLSEAAETGQVADTARADGGGDGWPGAGRRWLSPLEAAELLDTVGLRPVDQALADDVEEAVGAARRLGYPVALKASGLERLSKTEAGGVSLDVHGDDEVRHAYDRMCELLGDAMRPAVVQSMVPEGAECRVGIYRHPVLGDVLTLGPGGSAAERVADQVMQILPLTDADAHRLIDASVLGRVLDEQGADARQALVDLLLRLSALAEAVPEIAAVRLNPVLVVAGSAAITDARIGLQPFTPDTRPPVRRL